MTEINKLNAALNAIGSIFTEQYEHTDKDGVVETRNRLGFIQDKLLNGICYQLANAADYTTNTTLPRAQSRVQRAMRAHDGTELAELELNGAIDWIDRLNEQLALTEEALRVAKEVYTRHTGNTFSYGRRPQMNEGIEVSPAMARAKALGLNTNTAGRGA
jgi:hypothetical protein